MNKLLSCRYSMDTDRVEARFADGSAVAIDCIAIEDEYGNTPAQRAELDWLLYNKPLEYAQMVLSGEVEHYLSLGCDHGIYKGLVFHSVSLAGMGRGHRGHPAIFSKRSFPGVAGIMKKGRPAGSRTPSCQHVAEGEGANCITQYIEIIGLHFPGKSCCTTAGTTGLPITIFLS